MMVPYSADRWRAWRDTPEFDRYFRASGNASSSPHFQDWPAVRELRAAGAIEPDAVFVPGHSGDFLAGSHVPAPLARARAASRAAVIQSIIDGHYNLWDWPADPQGRLRDAIEARIGSIIGDGPFDTNESASSAFELWDCAERQAKFIVNSVRVYEDFGHQCRLPLFDAELMDFWSTVPVHLRFGRRLYFAYAAARQRLPVTPPNLDRPAPLAAAVGLIERAGLKPLAAKVRSVARKRAWRRAYDGGTMGWYAVVEPDEFRQHYTGREIAHAFFARKYLALALT
jgi:asparagine synthase (glutamine-hydrolysing)